MKTTSTIICGTSAILSMLMPAALAAPTADDLAGNSSGDDVVLDQPQPNGPEDNGDLDWGDAPDGPYPTLAANFGASHIIVPGVHLGAMVDGEVDGQPDPTATGDDVLDGVDDEDGVLFTSVITPGLGAQVDITASVGGFVDAWIDFDQDGVWGNVPAELIFSGPVLAGLNTISYAVPNWAPAGNTFARVRYNTATAGIPPTGQMDDGEVEDYLVTIKGDNPEEQVDWGDAPDPTYPTLAASNGAHHFIMPGFFMGNLIDSEMDGQPNANATGDDIANLPDEDGVVFGGSMTPGGNVTISVSVSQAGLIDGWVDFNQNGTWELMEQIFASTPVGPGMNSFTMLVPAWALPGSTYARIRFSSVGGLPPVGPAPDGEVEDYEVQVDEGNEEEVDFGDAPDPNYPTLLASNGARHLILPGMFLGTTIDGDPDGQPNANATGDDTDGNHDEDGVSFYGIVQGQTGTVDIVASMPGLIDAWIDFDQNGVWVAGEKILAGAPVAAGLNQFNFPVPGVAFIGNTFARVRYSQAGGLTPVGPAQDGEVQDHMVRIHPDGETLFDFGDAPDPSYPTLMGSNGARHLLVPGPIMGGIIDPEINGQPDPMALGDDLAATPDEDGVFFPYPLVGGQPSVVQIVASGPGLVDAWIDFNANGSWLDPADQILASVPVLPGMNTLSISVPAGSFGPTFARFRISTLGGLAPTGASPDGEVEDYAVEIEEEIKMDFGDAPDPGFPTLMVNLGAAHSLDGLHLGMTVDSETDGQPNATATGDDFDGSNDDDGIIFLDPLVGGHTAQIAVLVSAPGILDAWIDFDGDGTWTQADNHVAIGQPVKPGDPPIIINVPAIVTPHLAMARFRLSHGGTSYDGFAKGGEVEDYRVPVGKRIPTGVSISHSPLTLNLNWSAEPSSTSYSVHSSTTLSNPFNSWTIETPIPPGIPGLTWSEPITSAKKFYIVVAWP